jgi:hypothetical protein
MTKRKEKEKALGHRGLETGACCFFERIIGRILLKIGPESLATTNFAKLSLNIALQVTLAGALRFGVITQGQRCYHSLLVLTSISESPRDRNTIKKRKTT